MEQSSKLVEMQQQAADRAEEAIVSTLVAQGVPEYQARQFIASRVAFRVQADGRVVPESGELRALGSQPEHLAWFARQLHVRHAYALGGTPVPFGTEAPPENEERQLEAARRQQAGEERDSRRAAREKFQREVSGPSVGAGRDHHPHDWF